MTGRGLRGRQTARAMLIAAVLPQVLLAFLFIAQPNYIGPMTTEPPPIVGWLVPAVGMIADLVGLAWMIRIYRADPEGHASWFRFTRS